MTITSILRRSMGPQTKQRFGLIPPTSICLSDCTEISPNNLAVCMYPGFQNQRVSFSNLPRQVGLSPKQFFKLRLKRYLDNIPVFDNSA